MKITKTASGNKITLSKSEWQNIGKKAGWIKEAQSPFVLTDQFNVHPDYVEKVADYLKTLGPDKKQVLRVLKLHKKRMDQDHTIKPMSYQEIMGITTSYPKPTED